ncbi:hypothetical protein BN159_0396 [Streptomyces davaonensis JCM 4913]|uniref:Fibronectin type-III domain-containing protein n=2 Tax=Streptomyces davaonensis TaxID=348043 RepID=K4QVB5_STRDJ|nr:hypothetical protein BN159_0396 [Streptomyces davaonensis JCM 4913]
MKYRRRLAALAAALGLGLLGLSVPSTPAEAAPTWTLRWAPDPTVQGLGAFETLEDDRADSHTSFGPHIKVAGDAYRFDMHMVDRDTSTDRQRHEVTGNRTSSSSYLNWNLGETWRVTYSMYIPSSLMATTTFTHIMQTKQPGPGTSPITVTSLRRVNGVQTIEHKVIDGDVLVGRTNLEPLQNKWIDIEYEMKIGDGTAGSVRWVVKSAGTTIVDATKTGVDTFLADRVRPKWGIYRSLGDTSGSLRDTYLLLRNMRAYELTAGTPGDTQAPTVPDGLRSTGTTASSVSLAWNASSDDTGVTGYDVYRDGTKVSTVTGTSTTVSGLSASTSYSFTVRARDAAGNVSAASNTLPVTTSADSGGTDTQAPSAPSGLYSPSKTSSSVSLAWNASSDNVGVTGYDVYRGTTKVSTVTGTSATVSGLSASTAYSFTVKARDAAGNVSASSNSVSVTTDAAGGGTCPTAWSSTQSYVPGDVVSYAGHKYTATYYSTGAVPNDPTSWAVWRDDGAC